MPLGINNESKRYNLLNSWWSQEFLSVFQDLDEDLQVQAKELLNEINFADIQLNENQILLRFDHATNSNIRVEFAIEALSDKDLNHAKEFLSSSSLALTEITLGKLPSIFNDELLNSGVELIPSQLDAYKFRCSSCFNSSFPKSGQICEHSLALIYKFASEIDKDANLWLHFRGLGDLINEHSSSTTETTLKSFSEILLADSKESKKLSQQSQELDFNKDLTKINFDYKAALSLLDEKPSFDEEIDFKQFLQEIYDLSAAKADSLYEKWLDKSRNRKAENHIEIKFNKTAENYSELFSLSITIKKLLRYSLNQDLNKVYSAELSFTLLLLQTAVLIVKNGLYFPEIVSKNNSIFIRYKPIFNNDLLRNRLEELYSLCPSTFALKTEELLAEFLTFLVNFLIKDLVKTIKGFPKNDFRRAFLQDEDYFIKTLSEENNVKASYLWLSKLELQNFDLRPLLALEESNKNNFNLHLELLDLKSKPIRKQVRDLNKENLKNDFSDSRIEGLYKQLYLLQEYVPALKQIISTEAKAKPTLALNSLADLLVKADNLLPVLGLELALPASLQNIIKPKLSLKLKLESDTSYSFEYKVSMGEESISLTRFFDLLKNNLSELFAYDSNYALLSKEDRSNIINRTKQALPKLESFFDALYHYRLGRSESLSVLNDENLDEYFEDKIVSINDSSSDNEIPSSLNAKLKPHQIEGFNWLYGNYKKGFGSCLADDMGLGKTLQVIALFTKLYLDSDSKLNLSLVLSPSALVKNWIDESNKFSPELKVKNIQDLKSVEDLKDLHVIVSSYTSYRHKHNLIGDYNWEVLAVDEAHNIRNPQSKQSQMLRKLQANYKLAITATPVEKKLSDLWTVFDFINPSYLRTLKEFTYEFAIPVEKYREREKMKLLEHVRAPFLLRREKASTSIGEDFVKKNIQTHSLSLVPSQKEIYKNKYKEFLDILKQTSSGERLRLIQQNIRDLTLFLNEPNNSAKAIKLLEILKNILDSDEKAVIFTQYKETGEKLKSFLDTSLATETLFYHGSLSANKKTEILEDFSKSATKQILIITIKAGGTGLNLVQANHLIHYDFTWNKAQEDQATDRIYRIGQEKDVFIHRLITKGTFEQKFDQSLEAIPEGDIKTLDILGEFADLSN